MDKNKWTLSSRCHRVGLAKEALLCAALALTLAMSAKGQAKRPASSAQGHIKPSEAVQKASSASPLVPKTAMASTLSGEYVWYADHTFRRESYVGFLYYNETTLAMRYYAPEDAANGLVENEIDLYVTMKDGALTGERVIGGEGEENVSIVNYLHDLFYDLTIASNAAGGLLPFTEETTRKELTAFSADVALDMDAFIPVFGVRRVRGTDNKVLMEAVTAGRLSASDDTSFADFHGFAPEASSGEGGKGKKTNASKVTERRASNKSKKGKAVDISVGNAQDGNAPSMHFTLDDGWKQTMDNMWLLGDDAMVTVADMGRLDEEGTARYTRRLVQSSIGSYIDYRTLKIDKHTGKDESIAIAAAAVQSDGTKVAIYRQLQQTGGKDGVWYLFTMTAFYDAYLSRRTYFDGIRGSIRTISGGR